MTDPSEARNTWRRSQQFLPIIAVGLLGLATAVSAWLAVSVWEERLAKANFANTAGDYASVLQNGLDEDIRKFLAVRAFYDASVEVDPEEFVLFTSRLLDGEHAGKMRITWSPFVLGDQREAFEQQARSNGLRSYRIESWAADGPLSPAPPADYYFPILYSTAVSDIGAALGVDLNSAPQRKKAIERARDGDRLATAVDIELRNVAEGERGFFLALPVYRQATPHNTIEERRSNLRGILGATFLTQTVLDAILATAKLPPDADLYLYSAGAETNATPVYRHGAFRQPLKAKPRAELEKGTYWSTVLKVGDAEWTFVATPPGGRLTGFYRAWIVLAAVILLFGAVLAYMWAALRYALRLETANSKVMQLAQTDLLTSLANRRAFLVRLTGAFAASRRGATPFAVLYLDIDEFKDVNDTLGHAAGDLLLKEVVERLRQALRENDFVARFGGDEFAILLTDVTDPGAPAALADRIGKSLAIPFVIDGHDVHVTSSIGISLYAPDVPAPDAMMMQADLALYRAKANGRNCYSFHSLDLDQQVHERVRVSDELRVALEEGELELHYQPQVELDTGRIIGLEALVRWNHKTRGLLAPASFIPIAERTGGVLPLGQWVFDEACRQLRTWQLEGIAPDTVAVNVSGVQLKGSASFEGDIERSLSRWNIDAGNIELELTESALMDATQRHGETLDYLRRLGTKIAIDDFGTGYSSLKYLTVYPVNRLKLAQEFVLRVTLDYRNAAVVRAAIRLAHELGIDVIAEGVETEAQVRFLAAAGCQQAQGFYFSRPVTASRASELLREGRIEPSTADKRKVRSTAA